MTWLKDQNSGLPPAVKAALTAERAALVDKIRALQASPLPRGDKAVQQRFRTEDLAKLANQVVTIDRKLGR